MKKTFIAYRHSGENPKNLELLLKPVKEALERKNIDAYCTFFDEQSFKKKNASPKEIMSHAFSIIDGIDFLFIVQASPNKSEGMLIETGYCLAKGIPVIAAVKTGIADSYLYDIANKSFDWKDIKELRAKIGAMDLDFTGSRELKLYTDGGSRGNPGESAGAFIICKADDTVVKKAGLYLGVMTNNQAEYKALISGLKAASVLGARNLNVFMDSELIVKQLNGAYKVKHKDLLLLYNEAKQLLDNFEKSSVLHVPRALNKEADREVNRVLDARSKK